MYLLFLEEREMTRQEIIRRISRAKTRAEIAIKALSINESVYTMPSIIEAFRLIVGELDGVEQALRIMEVQE